MHHPLKLTAKGQLTLKKSILAHLGAKPGEKLDVELRADGTVALRKTATGKISDAFDLLYRADQREVSIEEMNEVIAQGWAGEI